MSTPDTTPRLNDSLCTLAASQLQMQTTRSGALDAGALGVMAVDAAVATIILDTRAAHHLWIVALALLGLSLGLAVLTLRLPGAERTGPYVADTLKARKTQDDNELEESLLEDLAKDLRTNGRTLARKAPLFDRAQNVPGTRDRCRARRETTMRPMKRSTVSQPPISEPPRTDATETGMNEKAHGDRNFEPMILPGLGSGPLLPEWVHRLFRRKDAPAAR